MKLLTPLLILLTGMSFACAMVSKPVKLGDDQQTRNYAPAYFGNIYGTVKDSNSGSPIQDANIYVTASAVQYLTRPCPGAIHSDQGPVIIPEASSAVRQAVTEKDGTFIVNAIPVYSGSSLYTVLIEAEGYDTTVVDRVLVLPGASMALRIDCRMTSDGKVRITKVLKGRRNVDINYSDEQ